jgi:hypothetical protein
MNIKLPRNTVIMLGNMVKNETHKLYQAQPHRKETSELEVHKMKEGLKKQMADKAVGLNNEPGLSMMTSHQDK